MFRKVLKTAGFVLLGFLLLFIAFVIYAINSKPATQKTEVKTEITKEEPKTQHDVEVEQRVADTLEQANLKEALQNFKQGTVSSYVDARKTTGVITVFIKLDDNIGARTQAGGTVSNTKSFIDALDTKPVKVNVNVLSGGVKVLQFEMDAQGNVTLLMAHPDIEKFLRQTNQIK